MSQQRIPQTLADNLRTKATLDRGGRATSFMVAVAWAITKIDEQRKQIEMQGIEIVALRRKLDAAKNGDRK